MGLSEWGSRNADKAPQQRGGFSSGFSGFFGACSGCATLIFVIFVLIAIAAMYGDGGFGNN